MIRLSNVKLAFGDRLLFDGLDGLIPDKSRIGLVGDNGVGKTTLLRCIVGTIQIDEGTIEVSKGQSIGYLPQDLVELGSGCVIDTLKERAGLLELESRMRDLEESLASLPRDCFEAKALLEKHDVAFRAFLAKGGYEFEAAARKVLKGLGFRDDDAERPCSHFSGGWKMRIALAAVLLSKPDLLLLDEPTNHLDTESMEWLEGYLRDFSGTLLAISHDRRFLENMVTQIAELSFGKLLFYKMSYDAFLEEREQRRQRAQKEYEAQQKEIEHIESFVERFRYKATKATQVQSRLKQLEKMERKEPPPASSREIQIVFPECPRSAYTVVEVANVVKRYGELEVFRELNFEIHRGERVALVGVNGAGKSTLSRLIGGVEEPTEGTVTVGPNVFKAFFSQESAVNLDYRHTVWQEATAVGSDLDALARRNLLGAFLFSGDDIEKPVSILSGGEKSRLALVKILLSKTNFLILDEPTNHLDMQTKELFQEALLGYSGTILIVSHDRYFLDKLATRVLEIRNGRLYDYPGNYSYFIEKRREQLLVESPPESLKKPESMKSEEKNRKREEAAQRNALYQAKRGLLEELGPLEERLSLLDRRKGELEAFLCDAQILQDSERVQEMMKELSLLEKEISLAWDRWVLLSEKLEEVEKRAG